MKLIKCFEEKIKNADVLQVRKKSREKWCWGRIYFTL